MIGIKPLMLVLGGAGIATASLSGTDLSSAPTKGEPVFFDVVLRANRASCVPNGVSPQGLRSYYRKVAVAKTELGPFPTKGPETVLGYLESVPPLWDNLGSLSMPITTANPRAQRYFDQGLRLAYAFNHAEARRAFRAAQGTDPDCAMCDWGEALVLGPNVNASMENHAL